MFDEKSSKCIGIYKGYTQIMFDEKSSKWIGIYKGYIQIMFWLYIIAAVVLGIIGLFVDITNVPLLDSLILLSGGALVALVHLVTNMLLLNFLNNVQVIRESVEKKPVANNNVVNNSPSTNRAVTQDSVMWTCTKCNNSNFHTSNYCEKCGTRKVELKAKATVNSNEWKCPNCGTIHQNYIGTCGCGERKPN